MKKPTTVEGWLKTLPEPLRSSALNQTFKDRKRKKASSMSDAIDWVNYWEWTSEGHEFWASLWEALIWAESKEG